MQILCCYNLASLILYSFPFPNSHSLSECGRKSIAGTTQQSKLSAQVSPLSLNYLLTVYKVRHQNSPLLSFHSPLGFDKLPSCLGTT